MNLTNGGEYPSGCYVSGGTWSNFSSIDWQNYRMMAETNYTNPGQQLAGFLGVGLDNLRGGVSAITGIFKGLFTDSTVSQELANAAAESAATSILGQISSKISSVEFMVDPIQFTETLTNTTKNSFIEDAIDSIRSGIGTEIAWITNSSADTSIIESLVGFLGDEMASVSESLGNLVSPTAGGFVGNLMRGAVASLKGQKMIYPKIYDSSNSVMNYHFSVTLTTPYGDPYNYYMNIIVPLMHLIALAAPRMVSANTVASPFLVQAYIPGMCTCQLGIVQNMVITKNPSTKHVSVNGYPLTVKVEFDIEELYNALSISPANDPASFMFNETLNDYLCNLAGLAPSLDTYAMQIKNKSQAINKYFDDKLWLQDIFNMAVERIENPFQR